MKKANEKQEVVCSRNMKNNIEKNIIFGILFILIFFGIGTIYGYVLTASNDNNVKEDKKVENTEQIQIEESYKIELFNEKHSGYSDITLKEDNMENFIKNTDYINDDKMRPYFLEGTSDYNLNSYKLAYVLSNYGETVSGTYFVSIDFLNKEVKKVFSIGLESGFESSNHLLLNGSSIYYICDSDICAVRVVMGGGAGYSHPTTEIVSSRKEGENTIYTLKEYYEEFQGGIYDVANGSLLCENNCPEDIIGAYGDKLRTYEMMFDKNNKYISSKKIN